MGYSKSLAREEFESEATNLRKLAKKISYDSSPLSYDHKQLIFQSCIFLLSARIEDYTKNLIENILFLYKTKGAVLKNIPENARIKALIDFQKGHFKSYYQQEDEKKLIKDLQLSNSNYQLIFDTAAFTDQIKSTNIIASNKYPSLKNLNKVFHRLGIDEIANKINIKARKDLKTSYNSFLSLRESIAHQSANSITIADVERHFDNVFEFINFIDRIVCNHICNTSDSSFWK